MSVSKALRFAVFERDNHTCQYCGREAPEVKLNIDHLKPKAHGGSDDPENLVTACVDCNSGKGSSKKRPPLSNGDLEARLEYLEKRSALLRAISNRAIEIADIHAMAARRCMVYWCESKPNPEIIDDSSTFSEIGMARLAMFRRMLVLHSEEKVKKVIDIVTGEGAAWRDGAWDAHIGMMRIQKILRESAQGAELEKIK